MATPSSPKLISPISTATNDAASPTKRPQPIPWSHQETVNLIKAYQEKWYSLKRGQLKASQWEEVAVVVAARCGYDFTHPSKSAVQCRHKMEKLRQRHRAEKHRLAGGASASASASASAARIWQYSGLMDELERGPLPISARPLVSFAPFGYNHEKEDGDGDDDDDEDDDDEDDDERENYIKSRSINYILSQRPTTTKYGGFSRFSREHVAKGMWRVDDGDDDVVVGNERGLVLGLTAEIRGFAERFIGVENLKMEMMKETERCRLEMENKRIEMILESQRRIVDSIGRAFGSSKRMKMSQ